MGGEERMGPPISVNILGLHTHHLPQAIPVYSPPLTAGYSSPLPPQIHIRYQLTLKNQPGNHLLNE